MDKFREPEQFDAEVEIHGGEPFAVWAPAVNGSHVKAELYFALLAELEANDKTLELEREKSRRVMSENYQQAQLIAELEAQVKVWESATTKHLERAEEAEKRLATPVRLPKTNGYWDEQEKAFEDAITLAKRAIWRAGFKVEGG